MDLEVAIGAVIVFLVACYRFNAPPPPKPSQPEGTPGALGLIKSLFQWKDEPDSSLFPPPRANTTLFKFWLYRIAYTCTGLAVYFTMYKVPGVPKAVQQLINLAVGSDTPIFKDAGPVMLALIVAAIFPEVPPLKGAERAIRRLLYERALIPAQQLSERTRLKEAEYQVRPAVLEAVRKKLEVEGFEGSDLVYEATPTVRSLWTKASLLIAHLARWQGKDKYKTAFAVLRERDSNTLSAHHANEAYEALKADAKVCFKAKREQPGTPETEAREAAFRRECKALLGHLYDLLSRVSLKSHFTDRERIKCMAEIGFQLEPREGGPTPDMNDLVALALLLSAVLVVPLSLRLDLNRALLVGVITYTAVLIPILIANRYPEFARKAAGATPALAFPVVSGIIAGAIGMVFSVASNSIAAGDIASGVLFDFAKGWATYTGRSYPWSTLHAIMAALVAWRIRTGTYPDPSRLKGIGRVRMWGDFWDAGIFGASVVLWMVVFVRPQVAKLWKRPEVATDWTILVIPAALALAMGFFVPTWYRANLLRMTKAREEGEPAPGPAPAIP
jgi:hypothetical protein